MKLMKKIMKNKELTFSLGLTLGVILSGMGLYVVSAVTLVESLNVSYNNSGTTLNSTTVQDALDELYDLAIPDLYGTIAAQAQSDNALNYSGISSDSDTGVYLYSGEQDEGERPIYFYRGAVTNNNVIFAGFCWKIVRTTGTGGIKLIYNGSPSNNQCTTITGTTTTTGASAFNSSVISPSAVGFYTSARYSYLTYSTGTSYLYGNDVSYSADSGYTLSGTSSLTAPSQYQHYTCKSTSSNCSTLYYVYYLNGSTAYYISLSSGAMVEDALDTMFNISTTNRISTIASSIGSWYSSNISSYAAKLEKFNLCNDKSINTAGGWALNGSLTSYLYFNTRQKTMTATPSLKCTNSAHIFNSFNYGLITVDEVMLAGGKYDTSNTSYYLYNGESIWTASPWHFAYNSGHMAIINAEGALINSDITTTSTRVRPMVSLAPDTKYTEGDGTATNPYIVN